MRLFWAVSLSIIFYLSSFSEVRADFSSWFTPTSASSVDNYWGGYTNLDADDNVYRSPNILPYEANRGMQGLLFSGISSEVPEGAIINSVEVEYKAKRRFSNVNNTVSGFVCISDCGWDGSVLTSATKVDVSSVLSTSERVDTFYWSNNEPTHTDVSDYFGSDFDPDEFTIYLGSSFGGTNSQIIDFDYVKVRLNWTSPVHVDLDNVEASASAQTVRFDLSGDTGTSGANISCKTTIFESCSRSGYAGWTSSAPVASIYHEDNGNTETVYKGGSEWESYGYSDSNSTWQANGITVPYNPDYDCEYPTHLVCTERVIECGELGCSWTDTIIHEDRATNTLTVDAGLTSTGFTEPEPTNPLAWVVWKLKQTFWELFQPDFGLINQEYQALKTNLITKAPFAYVYPIFNLDFDPVASEETLTLSLPTAIDDTYIPDTIEWTMPASLITFFDLFKSGASVILGLLFILYLFSVARRIF